VTNTANKITEGFSLVIAPHVFTEVLRS